MSFKREMPESVVIVRNEYGVTAILRYKSKTMDRIFSSTSEDNESIYKAVESYVMGKDYYGKARR
jgi:hypothetical protein